MSKTLPPLPEPDKQGCEDDPMYGILSVDYFTAEQMQAYARAAIEKDRERQSVPAAQDAANLLSRYERQWHRMGELWERHQGKGWPAKEGAEFAQLRDERAPATHAALLAFLAAPQPQPVQEVEHCLWARNGNSRCPVPQAQPQPVQQEPVMYQFRWTNPAGQQVNDTAIEWTQVEPRWNGTVQEKCAEILAYRYGEKPCYEVRALYTSPQAQQPLTPEWYARWIRNNYQDHPNIATLCEELTKAAHGITKGTT